LIDWLFDTAGRGAVYTYWSVEVPSWLLQLDFNIQRTHGATQEESVSSVDQTDTNSSKSCTVDTLWNYSSV